MSIGDKARELLARAKVRRTPDAKPAAEERDPGVIPLGNGLGVYLDRHGKVYELIVYREITDPVIIAAAKLVHDGLKRG